MASLMTSVRLFMFALAVATIFFSCSRTTNTDSAEMTLAQQIGRFAPTEITSDVDRLSAANRAALDKILAAAQLMDEIYFRQVWSGNVDLFEKLQPDTSPEGLERLHYYRINMGPWSTLDDHKPFVDGAPRERFPGANYYPEDMTKEEFETWIKSLPSKERELAIGFFHVVRRNDQRQLTLVPYSVEYRQWLEMATQLLNEAAALTDNATLRAYLTSRAKAFLSDDYYASDVTWMELDAPIDLTIGPYETYMDEMFGYKAAFEVYVTLRDDAESAKLARFSSYLQDIENNLPLDPRYRNPKLGSMAPIRVVDVLYSAGEGNRGVQTAAFNLPNDERVVREKGAKRVMLKNVQEAKFNKVLKPIAASVLPEAALADVSFDAFFTHILAHELMHGLGPHGITVNGKKTTVRQELKDLYSAVEEAKADAMGLFALQYLIDKGLVDGRMKREMYTTFLASMFRSVRFGINEAHGKGVAVQFNRFMDAGAIRYDEGTKQFSIVPEKIAEAVRALTGDILTLQAEGSYEKAKALLDTYGVMRPAMRDALNGLKDVPVDIEPLYPLAPKNAGAIR